MMTRWEASLESVSRTGHEGRCPDSLDDSAWDGFVLLLLEIRSDPLAHNKVLPDEGAHRGRRKRVSKRSPPSVLQQKRTDETNRIALLVAFIPPPPKPLVLEIEPERVRLHVLSSPGALDPALAVGGDAAGDAVMGDLAGLGGANEEGEDGVEVGIVELEGEKEGKGEESVGWR
jgi:hypothetical protein